MTTFTGYLVSLDVGSDGLGKSDEISSCSGGCHIFSDTDKALGTGSATFSGYGSVTGTFYEQGGQAFFVPDNVYFNPGGTTGIVDSFTDAITGRSSDNNIVGTNTGNDVIYDTDGDISAPQATTQSPQEMATTASTEEPVTTKSVWQTQAVATTSFMGDLAMMSCMAETAMMSSTSTRSRTAPK